MRRPIPRARSPARRPQATPSPSPTRRRVSRARSPWARTVPTVSRSCRSASTRFRVTAAPRATSASTSARRRTSTSCRPARRSELDTVEVVGAGAINPIDVTSVESTTILTAEQIAKIPVPRDTTSVALLAPGTVRGDAAFGNLASFGGSSVAENQYYVNGFNITNSFRSLNFSNVPFEGDRRNSRSRPVVTAPNSVVRWAA